MKDWGILFALIISIILSFLATLMFLYIVEYVSAIDDTTTKIYSTIAGSGAIICGGTIEYNTCNIQDRN